MVSSSFPKLSHAQVPGCGSSVGQALTCCLESISDLLSIFIAYTLSVPLSLTTCTWGEMIEGSKEVRGYGKKWMGMHPEGRAEGKETMT